MIKNLLLDMGGVILNVSYQKVIDTFKSYGIENFDKVYSGKAGRNHRFV